MKILPAKIADALTKLDESKLYELRLRTGGVSVNYGGHFCGLNECGLCPVGMTVSSAEIEEVVLKAAGRSIYAVNDQIKNGYLSLSGGVRIGICGEVSDKTMRSFSSLNIRFPHEIKGCAQPIIGRLKCEQGWHNTLIVSPPGCGKTTLLRDLVRLISNGGSNVLLSDEKFELSGGNTLDVGRNTDVMSGCDKRFAFSRGIRYMRPDVIAADEIMDGEDVAAIRQATASGVSVIASLHGDSVPSGELRSCFERIVVLKSGCVGRLEGIYDGKGAV